MPDRITIRCPHMNFRANVTVNRIEDRGAFAADVRVWCADCNLPFQFLGLEAGLDMQGARVSVDGLEARMAICPQGQSPSPFDNILLKIGGGGKRHG